MKSPRLHRFASEPFLHFAVLGALVFAGHAALAGPEEVPTIDVSVARQRELVKLFEQRQGRPPDDAERTVLIQRHVEDEVLLREGLRLSLPSTDPMLRAQLIARVRGLLQADVERGGQEPPSEEARKERTSRAFRAEVDRLTALWRVRVAEAP